MSRFIGFTLALLALGLSLPARAWPFELEFDRRIAQLSGTPQERASAAQWLGRRGDSAAAVRALLPIVERDPVGEVRRVAALALARRRDPDSVLALSVVVAGADLEEQRARVRALAAIDTDAARGALVSLVDATPRGELAAELAAEATPAIVPFLIARLPEVGSSHRVAQALAAHADARSAAPALSLLSAPEAVLRVAGLELLGALAAARALDSVDPLPAIRGALGAPEPEVALAALVAIGLAGSPQDAALLDVAPAAGEQESHLRARLESLARLDPQRAAPVFASALARPESAGGEAGQPHSSVRAAMIAAPTPEFAQLLEQLALDSLTEPEIALAAGDALGALGLVSSLNHVCASPSARSGHHLALALAVRSGAGSASERARAVELMRARSEFDTRLGLLALARDSAVSTALRTALQDARPSLRELGARALTWLGPLGDADVAALERAALVERDPGASEAMVRALAARGEELRVSLSSSAGAPWILGRALSQAATPRARRERAATLYEAQRSRDPRRRALALEALGGLREPERSRHPIAASLEDPRDEVRHAAALALARLGVGPTRAALRSRLAVEPSALVRGALRVALADEGAPPSSGDHALVVRLLAPRPSPDGIAVDAVLADGRWLRVRTWSSGELVLPDLPSGDADIRPIP